MPKVVDMPSKIGKQRESIPALRCTKDKLDCMVFKMCLRVQTQKEKSTSLDCGTYGSGKFNGTCRESHAAWATLTLEPDSL